jgi:RHS repeat-associated protein
VVLETRYAPFGEVRWQSGSPVTDLTYTGQRDDGFGLMDYNARFYAPSLGRFVSADSIVPGIGNALAWDRFSYVQNNPMKLTDPSGHAQSCPEYSCGVGLSTYKPRAKSVPSNQSPEPVKSEKPEPPFQFSQTQTYGYHLGSSLANVPDQSSDDFLRVEEYSICSNPRAAIGCLFSLATRFAYVGPQDTTNNFFILLTANYNESTGVYISDISLGNYTGQPLTFITARASDANADDYLIGKPITVSNGYHTGQINDSMLFDGNSPLTIFLEYKTTIDTGSGSSPGPSNLYPDISITLPSLLSLMNFVKNKILP